MPESKIISTYTTLSVVGPVITITTQYFNDLSGGVILAFISEIVGGETIDSIPFIEGEGGITINSPLYPSLNFSLNSSGELIVTGPNATQFSVDSLTGELIYTY